MRNLEFSDQPLGTGYFALAIGKVIRGDICALLKQGITDPSQILAALPTDADVARALWDTREE